MFQIPVGFHEIIWHLSQSIYDDVFQIPVGFHEIFSLGLFEVGKFEVSNPCGFS